MEDERIEPERPLLHCKNKPLVYRADGTAFYRAIGFALQTSKTFPELAGGGKKKGGKKRR